MGNYFFDPAILTIQPGDVVTWTNTSGKSHDTYNATNLWDSPLLKIGETWSFRFTNAGFYPYFCSPHLIQNQTGSVTVASAPANLPPVVSIGSPVDGSQFSAPARISITASASDPDGTVARVEYFAGSTKLGESTNAPHKLTWDGASAGSYALTARATDNGGASSTSSVVQVTVTSAPGPEITINTPTNGAVIPAPGSFDIQASVARGAATQVEFFIDNTLFLTDTSNPYRATVASLAAGVHTISAVATDDLGNKGTNSIQITVNLPPTVQITSPADGTGLLSPATFTLEASASDPDGAIAQIQFFRGTTLLGTVPADAAGLLLQGLAAGTYAFTATATDNSGAKASQTIHVIVKGRPTVAISAPAANARLTNSTTLLTGTAADGVGVTAVHYALNSGPWQPVTGTTSWVQALNLPAGTNVVSVRSVDAFGIVSLTNTRSVFQVVPRPISIQIGGLGTVSGATNGQWLEVGRGYQLTANPAPGYLFSNWTGQLSTELRTLSFLMQSNLALQVNFVPNPFRQVNGTFNGLFSEDVVVRDQTSGEFRMRVTPTGKYTATLRLAGKRYTASGLLDLTGRATNTLLRTDATPLIARWVVNLQGLDQVTGTLTDGSWTASLFGTRAVYHALTNRAPMAGRHTVVFEGAGTPGLALGDGWGTLTVNPAGVGTLAGSLADGTRVSRSAPVSKDGEWPLFAGLYSQLGSILGWVRFDTNNPANDLQGQPYWFRPVLTNSPFYPGGFALQPTLTGSRYLAPGGSNNVVALTHAALILAGGNLSQSWTNDLILGPNYRVTNASPNPLSMSLSPATGLFRGSFTDTNLARTVTFTGALLQKSARGAGWFRGTNQTGQVRLQAWP